jgi:hypothetical protein
MNITRLSQNAITALIPFETGNQVVDYLERKKIKFILEQKYQVIITPDLPVANVVEMLLSEHYNLDAVKIMMGVFRGVLPIEHVVSLLNLYKHQR